MIRSTRRTPTMLLTVLALTTAALVAGCSGSPAASAPSASPSTSAPANAPVTAPTVKLLEPAAAAVVSGDKVTVRVETTGLKFTMPSNTVVPGEGHVHFTLDDQPFEMSIEPEYVFKDVAPGTHTLRAELVQNDTTPFSPEVFETVEFTVE